MLLRGTEKASSWNREMDALSLLNFCVCEWMWIAIQSVLFSFIVHSLSLRCSCTVVVSVQSCVLRVSVKHEDRGDTGLLSFILSTDTRHQSHYLPTKGVNKYKPERCWFGQWVRFLPESLIKNPQHLSVSVLKLHQFDFSCLMGTWGLILEEWNRQSLNHGLHADMSKKGFFWVNFSCNCTLKFRIMDFFILSYLFSWLNSAKPSYC